MGRKRRLPQGSLFAAENEALRNPPRFGGFYSTIRTATTASHRLELYSEPHGMLRGISDGNTTVEVPSWLTVRFYLWTRRTR